MRQLVLRRRPGKTLPPYTVLRCPLEGHQVSWCRNLCTPMHGRGLCGRLAPHALGRDRTQVAIARYQERAERERAGDRPEATPRLAVRGAATGALTR